MKQFFYIFIFIISHHTFGQEPYAIHYTINDGLPTNTIYSSFQDTRGFIWFATDVGVLKYDSKNFTLLNTDNGLSDNEVFQIKEDFKGRKWFLTLNGKTSFIKNDTIFNDENSTLIQQIKSKSMFIDFFEDADENVYLVSRNGEISVIDKNDAVKKTNSLPINTSGIWKIGGKLYVLNSSGIYNPAKKELKELIASKMPFRVFHHKKETFYNDFNILYQVFSDDKIEKIATLPDEVEIINIYKESDTKIWICTRKGLYVFKDKKIEKHYFKNQTITSISKDIQGNYWLTTLNNGLYLVPSFDVFQTEISINTIAKKNNNEVWFGGFENDFYIKKENTFVRREFDRILRKDAISKIRFFKNATYIIGKAGTQKITNNTKIEIPININDLIEKEDVLFLATDYVSKISEKDLENSNYDKIYEQRILDRRTNVFTKDSSSIYMGTNIGLYRYSNLSKITFLGDDFAALKSSINDLFFDTENDLLLVATSSKGLILLENDTLKFSISKKDGLNNNTIIAIEKINKNEYLIGSNKGINLLKIDKDNFKITNYNANLGFENQKINAISYVNDTTYIATNKRLLYFNQQYLHQQKSKPILYIDDFFANNGKVEIAEKSVTNVISTKEKSHIKIKYDKNDIKINFTGISFLDKGDLDFYYKLNNNEWQKTKERQVSYQSLASNSYTFSVHAINGFNEKSDVKTINFKIEKPFWQTWWFLLLMILAIGFVIYYFVKKRLNFVQKQFLKEKKAILLEKENVKLENQMLALEQKALRLQMNPHFIFNALNTIKGYYSEGNVQEASNYISNFSKLLRLLLENVEQYIPLSLEVEMLDLYLQLTQVRYQNKFNYKIEIDKNLNAKETSIPTLLMQPIIENAIIHGVSPKTAKGNIIVSFHQKEDFLICSVLDDGIGRKASQKNKKIQHTSKAIKITKERLTLIETQENKKCNLEFVDLMKDKKSAGTKVIITIPLLKIW